MSIFNRNYVVTVTVLFIAALFMLKIEYTTVAISSVGLGDLPFTIGQWQGRELEVPESVYEILETKDVLMREYRDQEGDSVVLAVVYSEGKRDTFHPPEYCYIGGGAQLVGKNKEDILLTNGTNLATNKLVMNDAYGKVSAWYWFSARNRFLPSFYLQQAYLLLDALRGKELKGALIRVSVRGESQRLEDKAKIFIKEAYAPLKNIF